jgi:hypothetical protein
MGVEPLENGPISHLLKELGDETNRAYQLPDRKPRPNFEAAWFEDVEPLKAAWILKNILPRNGIGAIWGPPGSGKSFLALHLALSIARGSDVLGARCNRGGVLYLAAEDPDGIRLRIAAWRQEHGAEPTPFLFVPVPVGFTAGDPNHVAALVDLAKEQTAGFESRGAPLALIITDTFARSLPGLDENSAPEMSSAIAALTDLAHELNALVLIVHHAGKDSSRGERGHSSLRAALDVSLEVVRNDKMEARALKLSKSKNATDGTTWPFELKSVVLGTDDDGDRITSCVAMIHELIETAPKSRPAANTPVLKKLPPQTEIVGRIIASALHEYGGLALEADVFPKGLAVLRDDSNEHAEKSAKVAWKRAIEKLNAERFLVREDGVLAPGELGLERFASTSVSLPSQEKRMAFLRTLLRLAWQAGGSIRHHGVPWVSRDVLCNPGSEIHSARANGVDDLEAAGDIEADGEGFRMLTTGFCPEEGEPAE